MPRFDASTGSCEIYTYKAGMLSAVGHDLLLRVTRFTVDLDLDEPLLEGAFDGSSIEVVGAVREGEVVPGLLSPKDVRDILDNIKKYVFKGLRPERIQFRCDDLDVGGDLIEGRGQLTIPPARHEVDFEVEILGDTAVCDVRLNQPDWGITPFSALLGALRIQPEIRVRLTVPWDA